VFARDEASLEHVSYLTSQTNVCLAPDFTNLLTSSLPKSFQHLAGQVAIIPNSKMISSSNKNEAWREKYVDVLIEIVRSAQRAGQSVFLLNHEGKGDRTICERINQALTTSIEVVEPDSCLAIKAIIGQSAWVVSSRYHGCVSALSQSVPCLGTSWSHKYEALFADYEHQDWLLDISLDHTSLQSFIETFITNIDQSRQSLTTPVAEIKARAEKVWVTIFNTLKSHY
jgi:polysaccharide pyruvyl transferase WcaK-like protein